MTKEQIEKLASKGKWKEVLDNFCKENSLTIKYISKEDGCKRVEISFEGEIMNTLEGTVPEKDYNDISQALLVQLLGNP